MPPKRKPGIQGGDKFKTEADRKRWERANETPEQTRLRLETQRELQSVRRDGESETERAARLLTKREYQSAYLESQTVDRPRHLLRYTSMTVPLRLKRSIASRLWERRPYPSSRVYRLCCMTSICMSPSSDRE